MKRLEYVLNIKMHLMENIYKDKTIERTSSSVSVSIIYNESKKSYFLTRSTV
jgi:hypothetical protein